MLRRRPALGVLILVSLALCLSLSASLARSAQPALLTATPSPLPELAAYLPLIIRDVLPTATATATTSPPATASATASTVTPTSSSTTTTSTITPSTTATASATGTATATTTTGTATETATNTATITTAPTETTHTPTSTTVPTETATTTGTATASATSIATETATATTTGTATATSTATATATATSPVPPGAGNCVDNVFPITLNVRALENNLPYWYKPVPLANPYADGSAIPSLNTTNPNSPRFRAYSSYNNGGQFFWTRWNGDQPSGSTADLIAALTGRGTLSQGFGELPPPQHDPAAIPLVNGRLEAGDWVALNSARPNTYEGTSALDAHIANKTLMVLPVYDHIYGAGTSVGAGYRIARFAQVRLLSYTLGPNSYFEFALVEDNKQCFGTLKLDEKLEWYELGAVPNYDIVIVQDHSYSMRYCWDTTAVCATGTRRIDYAADSLRQFVNQMLVVRNQQQGADHRLAYVTFGQQATKRIDFNSDPAAALAQFKTLIGDLSAPRTIPNTELNGNTNIAGGLGGAVSYLNNARTVDKNGKPVKLVVVLLTDGIANVFNDGPATNVTNRFDTAPYYCGDNALDVENPLVQYNCPSPADYPGQVVSQPPLKAMVRVANDSRNAKGIEFYALALGAQNGLTPADMHLDEVAPLFHPMAANPTQLREFMNILVDDLTSRSCRIVSSTRTATGANVRILNGEGRVVTQGYVGPSGIFGPNLPINSGPYTVEASHSNVVAPQDPNRWYRTYSASLTIPVIDPAQPLYNLLLTTNVQCP